VSNRLAAALRIIPGERVAPPGKVLLSAEIVVTYVRVRWWLRRRPLDEVVAWTRSCRTIRPANVEPGTYEARLVGARLANAVRRTLRVLPTDGRCLMQTLVLSRLLSVRDMSSTVVIGADSAPDFEAHAWLEHAGRPLQPPQRFAESRLLEI
jgi:hypothetical protein